MKKQKSLQKASSGLVGALAIAGGTSAYGDIIQVTPPASYSIPLGTNSNAAFDPAYPGDRAWDVDGNGSNDFFLRLRYPGPPAGNGIEWQGSFNPFAGLAATNGIISYNGAFVRYGRALASMATIGPGGAFSTGTQVVLGSRYYSGGTPSFYGGFASGPDAGTGAVAPGTLAFAGFRFAAPDGTHYGWLQLSVDAGNYTIVGAAYESTPGVAIAAGAIPEPSTIAMLAVGAVGVLGMAIKRRRRSE